MLCQLSQPPCPPPRLVRRLQDNRLAAGSPSASKREASRAATERPEAARRRLRSIDLFLSRLLIKARLQRRTGLETCVFRRRDFNFLASRRIASLSRGALTH